MNIAHTIRRLIARLIVSNRYSRFLFTRIALDEKTFLTILNDSKCIARIQKSPDLENKLNEIVSCCAPYKKLPQTQISGTTQSCFNELITDISVGINWGPKAFPLTRHALFLGEGMHHLTESWLRRLPSDAFVVLMADSREFETARKFSRDYRQVKALIEVTQDVFGARATAEVSKKLANFIALDAIAVPLPGGSRKMAGTHGNFLPDLAPEYNRFQRLWHLGFRQFALLSFHGFRQMEISLFPEILVDRHKEKRCFIIGNSPSLEKLDMSRLKGELTLGADQSHRKFHNWGFHFNYWACVDQIKIEELALEYQDNLPEDVIKFIPFEYFPMLQLPNCCPVNSRYESRPDLPFLPVVEALQTGFGVTYTLLQLAAVMGCNPIYLIGVDHHWDTVDRKVLGESKLKPAPEQIETAYRAARYWMEEQNIEIKNATPDTSRAVFDKIDYETLF